MKVLSNKQEITGNEYSLFPQNLGIDSIVVARIYPTEKKYLKPLLGDEMYEDMIVKGKDQISNYTSAPFSGGVLPPVEKFPNDANYEKLWSHLLLQFVSICLTHECLPFIAAQVQTNGINQNNPQFATGLTIKDAQTLQLQERDTINGLWYEIEKFLCENADDYPLFHKEKCKHYTCSSLCNPNKQNTRIKKGVIFYGHKRKNKRHRH